MKEVQNVMVRQTVNAYEVMFIMKPFEEEEAEATIAKFEKLITDNNGKLEKTDRWGKKRLAYEIDNFNDGLYVLITFNAVVECIKELDRVMRIDENVLRHMIIRKGN